MILSKNFFFKNSEESDISPQIIEFKNKDDSEVLSSVFFFKYLETSPAHSILIIYVPAREFAEEIHIHGEFCKYGHFVRQ